ncbi:MAG: galactosyltransferase-related protein [Candidatus Hydrogenedentota bacterium]
MLVCGYRVSWGGLIFTEKETFKDLGGFDESLYCAEDSEFVLRLKKYGKKKGMSIEKLCK